MTHTEGDEKTKEPTETEKVDRLLIKCQEISFVDLFIRIFECDSSSPTIDFVSSFGRYFLTGHYL
jgi:hypothetical protein